MTEFIKQQQELADALHRNRTDRPSRQEIHQLVETIITNTGEEMMKLIEKEPLVFDAKKTEDEYVRKDTLKKHITGVTGVV